MREQFINLWKKTKENESVQITFDIENQTYIRSFRPKERLILLGGGHIAQPLCSIAAMVGFSVTVVDDRPDFANKIRFPEADQVVCDSFSSAIKQLKIGNSDYVAVITRGHRYDEECLSAILEQRYPNYLGLLGSRRRTTALLKKMEEDGFRKEELSRIHTPIGLSIGAMTIQEIAVSIVAELIQCRREKNTKGKSNYLAEEIFDLSQVEHIANYQGDQVLMLVYETVGSSPVKSGAFMTIDEDFSFHGTIGGGCAEYAAAREAFKLLGTGQTKTITVDLTNDMAGEEGMVCGGTMKVFMADI